METPDPRIFRPERPIASKSEDRLGFWPVAEALRNLLVAQPPGQGLAIGVTGKWGSGKSSILELALSSLRQDSGSTRNIVGAGRPIIVEYRPWLIGQRDALLSSLFDELVLAIDRTYNRDVDMSREARRAGRVALSALKRYVKAIKAVSSAAPTVDHLFGLSVFTPLSKMAVGLATAPPQPVGERRKEVVDLLRQLGRRIIVTIDDLDRLEPTEAVEVLRLVRAVADLPNITYVACFDATLLASSVETALGLSSGTAFLQKIFHATVSVPNPDGFDLRHWLQDEISKLLAISSDRPSANEDAINRLARVILNEGEHSLRSPRDVIRALNLISIYWPPISKEVDLSDLVWLLLTRTRSPEMANWVAEYVEEVTQFQLGATVNEATRRRLTAQLGALLDTEGRRNQETYSTLGEIFPAFKRKFNPGENAYTFELFNPVEAAVRAEYERENRLGAPNSARKYFAFNNTRGVISPSELRSIIQKSNNFDDFSKIIMGMTSQRRPQGGDMGEFLLETLANHADTIPHRSAFMICQSLADCLDDAVRGKIPGQFGRHSVWVAGEQLLQRILQRPEIDSDKVVLEMFESGRAFAWLSGILRLQLATARKDSSSSQLISTVQTLEKAGQIFRERVESGKPYPAATPDAGRVLWTWRDLGGEAEARAWCDNEIRSDEGLIGLLEGLQGWMATSGKTYYPLTRSETEPFIDFEACRSRITEISNTQGPLQGRAMLLRDAFAVGIEHEPDRAIPR